MLLIITKFIKQYILTIVNEFITENYVKLLVTNDKKDYKNIEKTMADRAIKNLRLINNLKVKITLFIKLINEFINFIDLI